MPHSDAHFATVIQALFRGFMARCQHTVVCTSPCIDLVNGRTSTVRKRKLVWDADDGPARAVARSESPLYSPPSPDYVPDMGDPCADAVDDMLQRIASTCSFPLEGTRYFVAYDRRRDEWRVSPCPASTYFGPPVLRSEPDSQEPAVDALDGLFYVHELYCSFSCELTQAGAKCVRYVCPWDDENGVPPVPSCFVTDRLVAWSEPRDVPFASPMGVFGQ